VHRYHVSWLRNHNVKRNNNTIGAGSIDACFGGNTFSAWTELFCLKSKWGAVFGGGALHTFGCSANLTVFWWYHGTGTACISEFCGIVRFWRTCGFWTIAQRGIFVGKKSGAHIRGCDTRGFAGLNEMLLFGEHGELFKFNQNLAKISFFGWTWTVRCAP
jgi:hypothetical protein